MQPKSNVRPLEFSGALKKAQRLTYIPQKTKRALRESDASQFFYKPASKRQFLDTFKDLQEEGLISPNKPVKKYYRDILRQRLAGSQPKSYVPLSLSSLPKRILGHYLLGHVASIDPKAAPKLRTLMQEWGITSREYLDEQQLKRLFQKLREEGKISIRNIGLQVAQKERLRKAWVATEREKEDTETGYYEDAGRVKTRSKDNLPKNVKRHIGRTAATSASQFGKKPGQSQGPTTSISRARAGQNQSNQGVKTSEERPVSSIYRQEKRSADDQETPVHLPDILA